MKTLSVKQPWAYLICIGIKDIENRTWKTKFRGRILIHTSMRSETNPDFTFEQSAALECISENTELLKSSIIGSVEIIDCVENHESIWAEEDCYNWVLANPIFFKKPIKNVKGKLNLWNYENVELIEM